MKRNYVGIEVTSTALAQIRTDALAVNDRLHRLASDSDVWRDSANAASRIASFLDGLRCADNPIVKLKDVVDALQFRVLDLEKRK